MDSKWQTGAGAVAVERDFYFERRHHARNVLRLRDLAQARDRNQPDCDYQRRVPGFDPVKRGRPPPISTGSEMPRARRPGESPFAWFRSAGIPEVLEHCGSGSAGR